MNKVSIIKYQCRKIQLCNHKDMYQDHIFYILMYCNLDIDCQQYKFCMNIDRQHIMDYQHRYHNTHQCIYTNRQANIDNLCQYRKLSMYQDYYMFNIGKGILHIIDAYSHHHNIQICIYKKELLYQANGNWQRHHKHCMIMYQCRYYMYIDNLNKIYPNHYHNTLNLGIHRWQKEFSKFLNRK